MNRRDVFRRLLLAAWLPALVALPAEAQVSDEHTYRGWFVRWRPWQYASDRDQRIGVWMAYSQLPPLVGTRVLYSAYPGGVGEVHEGDPFNTFPQPGQHATNRGVLDSALEAYKTEARIKLHGLIDHFVGPQTRPAQHPRK